MMPDSQTHEKVAFTMRLMPGRAAEYERRHEAIWPVTTPLHSVFHLE